MNGRFGDRSISMNIWFHTGPVGFPSGSKLRWRVHHVDTCRYRVDSPGRLFHRLGSVRCRFARRERIRRLTRRRVRRPRAKRTVHSVAMSSPGGCPKAALGMANASVRSGWTTRCLSPSTLSASTPLCSCTTQALICRRDARREVVQPLGERRDDHDPSHRTPPVGATATMSIGSRWISGSAGGPWHVTAHRLAEEPSGTSPLVSDGAAETRQVA
jgi:hypothetical protein